MPVATVLLAATSQSQALPPMDTVTVASGLSRPVFVTSPPGDHNRLFIVEQQATVNSQTVGRIRILNLQTGALQPPAPSPSPSPAPFLIVSGIANENEQGLLGLALIRIIQNPALRANASFTFIILLRPRATSW